jgi:7-cyano-7-deazaguanine synthase
MEMVTGQTVSAKAVTAQTTVALLASGGLDSSILLAHLIERGGAAGRRVQPIYVRSDVIWHDAELAGLRRFLAAIACDRLEPLIVLDLPLADLYGPHWSVTGVGVPGDDSADEAVYLPGRNALLIVKAAVWCRLHGIGQLALAPLRANPFPDATPEFFAAFEAAINQATDGELRITTPFAEFDKRQVMELGRGYPLHLTFSCIRPRGGLHCGRCNKCAERRRAFELIDYDDPTQYAAADDARVSGEAPSRRSKPCFE